MPADPRPAVFRPHFRTPAIPLQSGEARGQEEARGGLHRPAPHRLWRIPLHPGQPIGRAVDRPRPTVQHVRVDHGGADIPGPEQLLDRGDVVPVLEQVSGERVTESVTGLALGDSGSPRRLSDCTRSRSPLPARTTIWFEAKSISFRPSSSSHPRGRAMSSWKVRLPGPGGITRIQYSGEGSCAVPAGKPQAGGLRPCWRAQVAIWAREENSSLSRMCWTWVAAVCSLMNSRRAMSRFDRPKATRPATSNSRGVSDPARAGRASGAGRWTRDGRSASPECGRQSGRDPRAPAE